MSLALIEEFFRKAMVFLLPNSTILRRTLPNGVRFMGPNRKGCGGRGVYIFGNELEPEINFLECFLQPGDTFIDIGSNTGIYSLNSAKIVGDHGLVYSFDPNIEMINILRESSIMNGLTNIHLRPVCLSREFGIKSFWRNCGTPNSYSLHRMDPDASSFTVLVMTLDQLAAVDDFSKIKYIKIDAEGSEAEILDGAKGLIEQYKPIIQMEATIKEADRLSGYRAYRIQKSGNIICMPEDSQSISLAELHQWDRVY